MASLIRLQTSVARRAAPFFNHRFISTSQKSKDTPACTPKSVTSATEEKNWVSYGFDFKRKEDDRYSTHGVFFVCITLCLVVGGFGFAYAPDYNLRDWATREAFLELRRRESKGLPLVDPNLLDPSSIILPSDEDLGDTEIII